MTQDEIIRMAREVWGERAVLPFNDLERFAALVAEPWIETNKALAKEIIEMKKQAEQEPVAWLAQDDTFWLEKGCDTDIPLYAAPVRTKDLTDDEVAKAIAPFQHEFIATGRTTMNFARAVIKKFKEKNNANNNT